MKCYIFMECLQNSKFTYLSNSSVSLRFTSVVCRIQNLHISQTCNSCIKALYVFVEFKIYISLKQYLKNVSYHSLFVEFKIYISLKLDTNTSTSRYCLQNSKFTYLSNLHAPFQRLILVCRIQNLHISQTSVFENRLTIQFVEFKIYISLKQLNSTISILLSLQNSKFTYLSN